MPMNRVQFQPGLSMAEFIQCFGTQEQCEAAFTGFAYDGYGHRVSCPRAAPPPRAIVDDHRQTGCLAFRPT